MRKTKVKRLEALEKIRANRTKHAEEYQEAFLLYHKEVLRVAELKKEEFLTALQDLVSEVKAVAPGDKPVPADISYECCRFGLVAPVSHLRDYDQAILMLEMEVSPEIELESDQFACFIMDDWEWKEDFLRVSEFYKAYKSR